MVRRFLSFPQIGFISIVFTIKEHVGDNVFSMEIYFPSLHRTVNLESRRRHLVAKVCISQVYIFKEKFKVAL